MIPPVLTEMRDFLSESKVPLTRTDNARIDSAVNEKIVLDKLSERFPIEQQPQARHWWDFSIRDDGVLLPVNLKLTELGNASDNMNCKLGIYYALTGREPDFANETPWHDFFERLAERHARKQPRLLFFGRQQKRLRRCFRAGIEDAGHSESLTATISPFSVAGATTASRKSALSAMRVIFCFRFSRSPSNGGR